MEKFEMNGVEFCDFGCNNYSNGMHLVSAYPCPKGLVEDVLAGKFPGIYLNPSAPCTSEFFGVFGTKEQYKQFYQKQVDAQIGQAMCDKFGWGEWLEKEVTDAYKEELEDNYKDWWK